MKEIIIKTPEEIAKMRHSGTLLAKVFAMLDGAIREGITTMEINDLAEAFIIYAIGQIAPIAKRLVNNVYEAMWQGIRAVKPGATLGDIGYAIQRHAEQASREPVRYYKKEWCLPSNR